jgi:hypothetical protein
MAATFPTQDNINTEETEEMPLVEFEPTISVFERAKAFHASDCEATVIGVAR